MPEEGPRRFSWVARIGGISFRPYTMLLSLAMGSMIWIYVDSSRTVEKEIDVGLVVEIPPGWEVESPLPQSVQLNVRGARQVMASLKPDAIWIQLRIAPGAGTSMHQEVVPLLTDMVNGLSPEVSVREVAPAQVHVRIVKLVERQLPIVVTTVNRQPEGYEVVLRQADPLQVPVRVPEGLLSDKDFIETEALDLAGRKQGFSEWVKLVPFNKGGRTITVEREIYATVEIVERPSERALADPIPVSILLPADMQKNIVRLNPPTVKVKIEGPVAELTNVKAEDLRIYVDARDRVSDGKGNVLVECKAMPMGRIRVVEIVPPKVKWRESKRRAPSTTGPELLPF